MTVLDQSADALGSELYRISTLLGAPEFVKRASLADLAGAEALPSRAYALPAVRAFPVHTPAATWASAAWFETKSATLLDKDAAVARKRLDDAAAYWGITSEVSALRAKAAAAATPDLRDGDYALVLDGPAGPERHCPLRNRHEVKAAAAWLRTYRDEFAYGDRRHVARAVLAKAAAYGADLPEGDAEFLERQAGLGTCAAKTAAAFARARSRSVGGYDRALADDLDKAAALLEDVGAAARSPATLAKLAAAVDAADRLSGLSLRYGRGVDRPEDVLFAVTEKVAAEALHDHVPLVTGSLYKLADLCRLTATQVEDVLGTETASALSGDTIHLDGDKLAEVLPTLPRADAAAFDRLAARAGIAATEKTAGALPPVLRRSDLAALAAVR